MLKVMMASDHIICIWGVGRTNQISGNYQNRPIPSVSGKVKKIASIVL